MEIASFPAGRQGTRDDIFFAWKNAKPVDIFQDKTEDPDISVITVSAVGGVGDIVRG